VPLQPSQPPSVLLGQVVHLAVVHRQHAAVLDGDADMVCYQRGHGGGIVRRRRENARRALLQPVHHAVEQGDEDGVLAAEVPVHARPDDARLGSDVGHSDRVEAPSGGELGGHGEDALTAAGVAWGTRGGGGRSRHLLIMTAARYGRP
jgi:hypothetical protein